MTRSHTGHRYFLSYYPSSLHAGTLMTPDVRFHTYVYRDFRGKKQQQQQQQKTVLVAASYFTSVTGLCFLFSDMFNFF